MGETTPHTPAPSPTEEHAAAMEAAAAAASSQPTNFKVIIIGAGMAGLSAANHLLQNGCDSFCILEARGRIGGRIVSIPLAQQKVSYNIFQTYVRQKECLFLFLFLHFLRLLLGVISIKKKTSKDVAWRRMMGGQKKRSQAERQYLDKYGRKEIKTINSWRISNLWGITNLFFIYGCNTRPLSRTINLARYISLYVGLR